MAKRKLRAKWHSIYHVDFKAHHLNLNSKCLCERLLEGLEAPASGSKTDNPSNISCAICNMAWDAINELGIKMKWPVSMFSYTTGPVIIPLPHWATIVHHRERILKHMGGLEVIMKSSLTEGYKPLPPKAMSVSEQASALACFD